MNILYFFSVSCSGDCHLGMTLLYVRVGGGVDLHYPPQAFFLKFVLDSRKSHAKGKMCNGY